jgi:hypothetical protein
MEPSGLGLLRSLNSEVNEVGEKDAAAGPDARKLFHQLMEAAANYNQAVLRQTMRLKSADCENAMLRQDMADEAAEADRRRTIAHEALISCHAVLVRFCFKHRKKPLTLEGHFAIGVPRNVIGDLAGKIREGLDHARVIDPVLYANIRK